MLTIIYSDLVGFGVVDAPPFSTDVQLHGLALAQLADDKLREALGVPDGLTAEQVEVARLEGELDAARADGRIERWRIVSPGAVMDPKQWAITMWERASRRAPFQEWRDSRLEAARAAVEHVRTLTVPAPKPRPVEDMSGNECRRELAELTPNKPGWTSGTPVPVMWVGNERYTMEDGETLTQFYRRLIAAARALDAEGEVKP